MSALDDYKEQLQFKASNPQNYTTNAKFSPVAPSMEAYGAAVVATNPLRRYQLDSVEILRVGLARALDENNKEKMEASLEEYYNHYKRCRDASEDELARIKENAETVLAEYKNPRPEIKTSEI